MKPILVFRHIACEGPGFFGDFLDHHAIPWRIVAVDGGEPVPTDPGSAAALVFMGGSMSVNDPLPWLAAELSLIRKAIEQDVPVLGHCLGGQLISKALGGQVTRNPVREIGWHAVRRVGPLAGEGWADAVPHTFEAFHWHGETFSIPPGAQRILESAACPNQAFTIGNTLALQCHIEMTGPMVAEWARCNTMDITDASASVQTAEQMTRNLDARVAALQAVAARMYHRWLVPLLGDAAT